MPNLVNHIPENCTHKWVHLRKSDTYGVGYRRWAHSDTYYCEKCLAQRDVEVEHQERPTYRDF